MNRTLPALLGATALTGLALGPALAEMDPQLFAGLSARAIGPAGMSGRITIVQPVNSDPNIIYTGTASGGVWKSVDGGMTWQPIFDDQDVHSIGSVAVNQANPDIVWVGTGEADTRNSVSIGRGVYKSLDGGKTWQHMGLAGTERINWIKLHPGDPDIAYVAALGTLWGPNQERGVFKTTDGGATWHKILYVDENTGATDVEIDPSNPDKLFAAMWQFRRWPYYFESGGPGSSLWRSIDGGESWEQITPEDGLPDTPWGKADFAIAPSDPSKVYLILETGGNNVAARSDDGGYSWSVTNKTINNQARPFYYTEIQADPENPNRVYNVQSTVHVSIDGGKDFEMIPGINCCSAPNAIHIDVHSLWINPNDNRHLMVGNDGGIAISYDMGEAWRHVSNLPVAQFYHVRVDDDQPYHIYGGMQDNGSWRGPSEVWENGGIRNFHWQEVFFGDGFDTVPDPEDSMQGYAMAQGGFVVRWNMRTGETRFIRPEPPDPETKLRFNWTAGIALDPFDPATVYYGSQFLHKSTDRGVTWEIISPDLTTDNPEWQKFNDTGGLTPDVTNAENYESIVAIAPSPLEEGVIWVGTDDGRLHVTRDGGETWQSLEGRVRGVPDNTWIPHIEPSPHEPGTAFVVFDNHRRSDMETYVYRADDYGRRFTSLAGDELDGYALSIQQDPVNPELLFLGTEFGLYVSFDGGGEWMKWRAGVPTASVMDIAIQERESDLVLGTHGRATFVIDDYSGLRALAEEDFGARLKLLSATDGIEYTVKQSPSIRFDGATGFRGPNQPYGSLITFIASGDDLAHPDPEQEKQRKIARREAGAEKPEHDGKVTVEVTDAQGEVVRTFKEDIHQGINRVVWGLESDGAKPMPNPDAPERDELPGGALVVPGTYTVTLKFDGREASTTVEVSADPREQVAMEALQANYDALKEISGMQTEASEAVSRILEARGDVEQLKAMAAKAKKKAAGENGGAEAGEGEDNPYDAFTEQADAVIEQLNALEKTFRVPPDTKGFVDDNEKIATYLSLAGFYVGSTSKAPNQAARWYMDQARAKLDQGVAEIDALFAGELAGLKAEAQALGLGLLADVGGAEES